MGVPEPITFTEYQEAAGRTRVYPAHAALLYPVMKLAGEAGEVAGKVGAHLGDRDHDLLSGHALDELALECGDVLWYLAATSHDLGLPFEGLARYPAAPSGSTLAAYAAGVSAQRASAPNSIVRLALRLSEAAGSVAEAMGKLMRDNGWRPGDRLTATQQANLATKARVGLEVLALLAEHTPGGLDGVARRNVAKLASRHERGVIHGSGDKR